MTDTVAGICLIISAFFFGLREILLSPKTAGWPPAPKLVRFPLFMMVIGCLYRGVELISNPVGYVPMSGVLLTGSMVAYSFTLCLNVARQYYPKAVWDRVERIMTLADCRQAAVLIALTRQGVRVFFPNRPKDPTPISLEDVVDVSDLPQARS